MRSTRFLSLLLLAGGSTLLTAGCGTSTSPRPDEPAEGEPWPLKISYFRAYPEPRTQRLEPSYRAVMSNSWKDRFGESPRDVLGKAAPTKRFTGFLSDAELGRYLRVLRSYGLDSLRSVDTDSLNPQELNKLAVDAKESTFTRVITVATDKGSRSYRFRDQQISTDLIAKFVKCESFVTRITEYSMEVKVLVPEKDRVVPRDR